MEIEALLCITSISAILNEVLFIHEKFRKTYKRIIHVKNQFIA